MSRSDRRFKIGWLSLATFASVALAAGAAAEARLAVSANDNALALVLYRVGGTRLVPLVAAFVRHWAQGAAFSANSRMVLVGNMVERNVQVLRWDLHLAQ